MSLATAPHPTDAAELQALVVSLQAAVAEKAAAYEQLQLTVAMRDAEIYAKTLHIEKLKAQLLQFEARTVRTVIREARCRDRADGTSAG